MPIVSGFVVPKMNPTRHVGNIRLLRPVVVTVEHQEDSQAENYESKDKEEPEEIRKHSIFRLDAHYSQTYLCAITQ